MKLSVNGQVRQDAYCSEMLFKPHQTLTELSGLHDLGVGDLIATGTPSGCAAKAPGKLAIAAFSPPLDPVGNSVRAAAAATNPSRQVLSASARKTGSAEYSAPFKN